MSITDIIAFLAFIVALYSATLSTYTAINEFFRLKIFAINPNKNFVTLSMSDYYQEEGEPTPIFNKNKYTIGILVRITNKSKNSTTINEILLNKKYAINSSSKFDCWYPISFRCIEDCLATHESKNLDYPCIKPLLKLNPLTSYECYLIFDNIDTFPSKFSITINTVQKSKKFRLKTSITNDYRNSIIPE